MADLKISQLTNATTPLAGTEVIPVVQGGTTKKVPVADLTAGREVAMAQLDVDNIRIDGNTISSTDTDGNIELTPNGTGEVDISKVDIDGGAIDGTTIGGTSASNGTFTQVNVDNIRIDDNTISSTDTNGNINLSPNGSGITNTNGISRITISKGIIQQLYSTSTTVFIGDSVARTNIIGNDGGEAIVAYQDWRSGNNHSLNSREMLLYIGLATSTTQTAVDRLFIAQNGSPRPVANNSVSLGAASNLWSEVFAGNGTINTSDAREKTEVRALTTAEIAAAKDLGKEIGAFKFLESVARKGDDARSHIGMTVQRAMEIMQSHDLDPMAYGFICYDQWDAITHRAAIEAKPAVLDDEGNVVKPAVEAEDAFIQPGGDRYGFRTDQLLLFIARGFEARLTALESK